TGGFWVRDLALFAPTRLGWRSRLELPTGSRDYNPNATRFETGTVDAAAFVGLRQTLVVHRLLGSWVSERVRALRRRLLERVADRARARRRRQGDQTRGWKGARADGGHRRRASGPGARPRDRALGRAGDDPREQRGHGRPDGPARALERRALAPQRRDQRRRHVPRDARRPAGDARPWVRAHRDHFVGCRVSSLRGMDRIRGG